MASAQLEGLYRARNWGATYQQRVEASKAYKAFGLKLAKQLPFTWHALMVSNPSNNQQGNNTASHHIIVGQDIHIGRLKRKQDQRLCPDKSRWGRHYVAAAEAPTCKQCLEIAERIVATRKKHIEQTIAALQQQYPNYASPFVTPAEHATYDVIERLRCSLDPERGRALEQTQQALQDAKQLLAGNVPPYRRV